VTFSNIVGCFHHKMLVLHPNYIVWTMRMLLMHLFLLLQQLHYQQQDGMYIVLQIKYNIQNNVKMGVDFGPITCMQYNGLPKAQQFF
jgi:hypothetical protein